MTATVGVVTTVGGVVIALAAVAVTTDWRTGPWTEALLVIGVITVVVAVGWILIALAIAALLRATGYFLAPAPPPGLTRISAIIEQRLAEQQEAAAARQRREPPPAEIVVALRAITGHGRR